MRGDEKTEPRLGEMPEIMRPEDVAETFREAMIDHYRTRSVNTGFAESTLAASDYLNRFQELVNLLEGASQQLEDFAHDFLSWTPVSPEDHVSQPEGDGHDLAAHGQAFSQVRARFDEAVLRLHGEAVAVVDELAARLGDSRQGLNQACDDAGACLRILMDEANAIARGETVPSRHEQDPASNVIYAQFGKR
jgi:hypothetical protein